MSLVHVEFLHPFVKALFLQLLFYYGPSWQGHRLSRHYAATAANLGASKKSPSNTPSISKISLGASPVIPPSTTAGSPTAHCAKLNPLQTVTACAAAP